MVRTRLSDDADDRWMRLALMLARRGEGKTRPNPPVGAVVVRDRRVVGRGYHRQAGGPHAEVWALREAGPLARGATLYVTLEPCSTWGRTPPCTDAILAAGITRVVVATGDPNPRHKGRGLRLLRAAGVKVRAGVLEADAVRLIRPFASWMCRGRPWVTLKLAVTLDGRIADGGGRSRWITGPASRRRVQALRRASDAIVVGVGTALADDPSLLPRPAAGRNPWRVIVDSAGRLPLTARVLTDAARGQTLIATTRRCTAARAAAYEKAGAQVVRLPSAGGRVSTPALLRALHRRNVMRVLCEGGGDLAAGWLAAKVVDELVWFVAPKILGGHAVNAVRGAGWPLARAPQFVVETVEQAGGDVVITCSKAKPTAQRARKAGKAG
jgi:diaminohydroxyphosphoribosylaminopyrimidine deaminase/5-amino-6-(5-phosphoribosylamino)uracil reductase